MQPSSSKRQRTPNSLSCTIGASHTRDAKNLLGLPDELLHDIIVLSCTVRLQRMQIHLGGVCQRLRKLLLSAAEVWSDINVEDPFEYIKRQIELSGNMGLDITNLRGCLSEAVDAELVDRVSRNDSSHAPGCVCVKFWELLLPHVGRWEKVTISDEEYHRPLRSLLTSLQPQRLRSITMTGGGQNNLGNSDAKYLVTWQAPQLVVLECTQSMLEFSLDNIRLHQLHLNFTGPTFPLASALNFLSKPGAQSAADVQFEFQNPHADFSDPTAGGDNEAGNMPAPAPANEHVPAVQPQAGAPATLPVKMHAVRSLSLSFRETDCRERFEDFIIHLEFKGLNDIIFRTDIEHGTLGHDTSTVNDSIILTIDPFLEWLKQCDLKNIEYIEVRFRNMSDPLFQVIHTQVWERVATILVEQGVVENDDLDRANQIVQINWGDEEETSGDEADNSMLMD